MVFEILQTLHPFIQWNIPISEAHQSATLVCILTSYANGLCINLTSQTNAKFRYQKQFFFLHIIIFYINLHTRMYPHMWKYFIVSIILSQCCDMKQLVPLPKEWDSWSHKPGLIHLSLVHSPGPSVVLCVHYQQLQYFTKLAHCQPVDFIYIIQHVFVLIHDYTLYFTGSPCCNFSQYNYISI